MIHQPQNTITGQHKPHAIRPQLLKKEHWAYHPIHELVGFDQPIVMWTDGAVHYAPVETGVHDGLRDGAFGGSSNFSGNTARYCLLADWLAAGNKEPA